MENKSYGDESYNGMTLQNKYYLLNLIFGCLYRYYYQGSQHIGKFYCSYQYLQSMIVWINFYIKKIKIYDKDIYFIIVVETIKSSYTLRGLITYYTIIRCISIIKIKIQRHS